jgi:hypothetical protein
LALNHRGRHQAQGHDIPDGDCSRNWAQDSPYPAATGHIDLTSLEAELGEAARAARSVFFRLARRFIDNAKKGGGVGPTSVSFPRRPKDDSDVRVDIEVKKGLAFT